MINIDGRDGEVGQANHSVEELPMKANLRGEMTSRRVDLLILLGIGITIVSFIIGRWWGSTSESGNQIQAELSRYDPLANLDMAVLQTLPTRSNTMTSGIFLKEVWFLKSQHWTNEVLLHCENGQISVPAPNTFSRNGNAQSLSVTGNVVSWTQEGALYEANPKYVGIVDGDGMWGRVYGWNLGDQSVGFWRIYPKAK